MRATHPRLVGSLFAAALILASCSSGAERSEPATEGSETGTPVAAAEGGDNETVECGVLVAGIPEDFDVVDPHIGAGETPATWLSLVYETIVGVDVNGDVTDGLATDWTISDDGLTYTFTLRDGVTFQNGETLDSSDVKWNLERIINPDTAATSQSVVSVIDSIDTPDPQTVVLNLSSPSAPLLSDLAQQGRVAIMHPDSVDESNVLVEHIGTGPFAFESYSAGDRLVLTNNPDYWGENARLAGIEVQILPDATSRLSALASGELDFAWALPAEDASALAEDGNFTLQENVQNRGNFFAINLDEPPFDDPRVREAMWLAVSRTDIAQAGWNGFAVPTLQPFNENSFWYIDREVRVDADLDTARALIEEAGVVGESVTILQWDQLGSDAEAQIVASAWNDIGLDATIEKVSGADIIGRAASGDNDVVYLWVGLITDPNRPYNLFESDALRNGVSGGMQSPEMDAVVAEARETSDPDARKALYEQALQINLDEYAMFYTVRPFQFVGVSNDVTGYEQGVYYVEYQGGGMSSACVPA